MFSLYLNPPQNHKRRLWKTINAPLCEGGVYGFGVCVYGFLGCYSFGRFERGRFCFVSLVVWGWLGCVGVEGWGGGGWCFPFRGSLGGFPSEGSRMGLLCLLKGGHGGWLLETTKTAPGELKASRGLRDVIYEALTPPKKVLKMTLIGSKKQKSQIFHQF